MWINRDQRSFEWFVHLLSQLEMEQAELGGVMERFLDLHMYITSALNKSDMKAVGLQMALDLLYANVRILNFQQLINYVTVKQKILILLFAWIQNRKIVIW